MSQSKGERIPYRSMGPGPSRKRRAVRTPQGGAAGSRNSPPAEIVCPSCGAPFSPAEPRCPYCGAVYIPTAEQAYMDHLEDVREDLVSLRDAAARETGQEIRRSGRLVRRILVILLLIVGALSALFYLSRKAERTREREDYLWRSENFPILDQYYEAGDYDAMVDFYEKASAENYTVYEWKHAELARMLWSIRDLDWLLGEAETRSLSENEQVDVLYYELTLYTLNYRSDIPEEDRRYLEEVSKPYLQDMESRFGMTEEEKETFVREIRQRYGFPDYDSIRKYLKNKQ